MFETKMVRIGNFDALEPIKCHRSLRPRPIERRLRGRWAAAWMCWAPRWSVRPGQQKMVEGCHRERK